LHGDLTAYEKYLHFPNHKGNLMKIIVLFYIDMNLFNIRLNRNSWSFISAATWHLLLCSVIVKLYEENLAFHK
jgi:hypothetical protein